MTNPKAPTSIIDKNGKQTTVHKNIGDNTSPTKRVSNLVPRVNSQSSESMSNLEDVLRNYKGINIILRHKLINAYNNDDGVNEVPRLIAENERLINDDLLPLLRKLAVNEDADLDGDYPTEHTSKIITDYSENATEFEVGLRRSVEDLRGLDRTVASIKADVLNEVADLWVQHNQSPATTGGFYDFKLKIEEMAAQPKVTPEQKQGYNVALNRIQYYVGH